LDFEDEDEDEFFLETNENGEFSFKIKILCSSRSHGTQYWSAKTILKDPILQIEYVATIDIILRKNQKKVLTINNLKKLMNILVEQHTNSTKFRIRK
jgi:hypothetical protein